jgi:hypothetical protein
MILYFFYLTYEFAVAIYCEEEDTLYVQDGGRPRVIAPQLT